MSNLQILHRDEVLPADLSKQHKSAYDGRTVHLLWIEQGPDVKTFLCEGVMVQPEEWYHEGQTVDGQVTEGLYVKLPGGHTYLGLTTNLSLFEFNGDPWLLAKGPLPRGTLDASKYPRLEESK